MLRFGKNIAIHIYKTKQTKTVLQSPAGITW